VLTLEDPYRFERSRSVGAYLGDLILCTEPLKECELPESDAPIVKTQRITVPMMLPGTLSSTEML
jgi:hypothetical protein